MLAGLPDNFTPMIMPIEHSGLAITAYVINAKLLNSEPLELMGVTLKETQNTEAAFSKRAKSKPRAGSTDQSTRATKVLEIVHADVCGPMETKSIGLSIYFLLFVDDYSRM